MGETPGLRFLLGHARDRGQAKITCQIKVMQSGPESIRERSLAGKLRGEVRSATPADTQLAVDVVARLRRCLVIVGPRRSRQVGDTRLTMADGGWQRR